MRSKSKELRKKEKFLNIKIEKLKERIEKLKGEINLAQMCLEIREGKNLENLKDREFLKDVPIEILEKFAPESVRDPIDKNLKKHLKNTGVYLWANGYKPTKFLGAGCNGVVWQCGDKAVKVTCNRNWGPFTIVNATAHEIEDVRKLNKVLGAGDNREYKGKKGSIKTIKPERYISVNEDKGAIDSERHIFESKMAKGDLSKDIQNKRSIDDIIRIGKQVLKALKVIHDAGYSHNDVKPDNLLLVERISKRLGTNKEAVKLSDFGAMTEINKTRKTFVNSKCYPPDWYNTRPEAVAKRDVYALGISLLSLLMRDKNMNRVRKAAKELYSEGSEIFFDKDNYKLKEVYGRGKNGEKLLGVLQVIRPMTAENYKTRLSIDESLIKMERISS